MRGMAPRHIDKDIRANYQIDNFEIAAGGFGKVFRASDRKHPERQVAIKSMLLSSRQHQEVSENEVNLMLPACMQVAFVRRARPCRHATTIS